MMTEIMVHIKLYNDMIQQREWMEIEMSKSQFKEEAFEDNNEIHRYAQIQTFDRKIQSNL